MVFLHPCSVGFADMVREGASPLPVPPPMRIICSSRDDPEYSSIRINAWGDAHAAGGEAPQERLTSSLRMDDPRMHQSERTEAAVGGAEPPGTYHQEYSEERNHRIPI